MICEKCGSIMANDDAFCAVCGAKNTQQSHLPNQGGQQGLTQQLPELENSPILSTSEVPGQPPRNNNTTKIIIIIIAVTVVIIAGIVIAFVLINNKDKDEAQTTTVATMSTTQKDDYSQKDQEETAEPADLLNKADSKIKSIINSSAADNIELSVINVQTGEKKTYGSSSSNTASALVLYPILYTYATQVDNGYISEEHTIVIENATNGRGILGSSAEGDRYSVEKLFSIAFEYSDNTAINALITYYGYDKIEKMCRDAGYNSVRVEKYVGIEKKGANNTISSSDLAEMMREMMQDNGFAKKMMNAYGKIRSKSAMGMGYVIGGSYENFNGYTDYVYNETIHLKDSSGDYVLVLISDSGNWKQGRSTAEELGGYLKKCID